MRRNLVLIFIFLFAATIIGRLVYIQILEGDFYRALAQGQQKFFAQVQGERGEIFFRKGEPLAINRNFFYVFASPPKVENAEETAIILKEFFDLVEETNVSSLPSKPRLLTRRRGEGGKENEVFFDFANARADKNFILERITQENSFFELIKNRLSREKITNLKKLDLPGIYFGRETLRYYPQNFLASQIIGFVGGEGRGQYGIEDYYDEILQGKEGFQRGKRDVWGRLLGRRVEVGGQAGNDLVLTIDYNIQFTAERLLERAYEDLDIKSGQIIVMNPITGEILAMANFPNFNPNYFAEFSNLGVFKNSATQKIFEPGSVFKAITMAIALNQEKIIPETTYIDEGMVKIGNRVIRNFDRRVWGERTMTEVLEKSINTGIVFVAQQLGSEIFLEYLERFGFFEITGIDLQGEAFFYNRELRRGREISIATASFGHGVSVTPIQLARAFAVFANEGRLVEPFVVKEGVNRDKASLKYQQIISPEIASQITTMLVSAVDHPFRRRAQVPGYYVAGKTGTAEIPWAALGYDKLGYSDKMIHTFVGFAPAYNPQFLILVKLDQPQGVRTASLSAAPIFQELAKHIINLWQIPPDYK